MVINLQPINNYTADKLPSSSNATSPNAGDAAQKGNSSQQPQSAANGNDSERKDGTQAVALKAANDIKNNGSSSQRAFFAVDDKKNVVIKVVDSQGNVVKQVPPEEYLKSAEALQASNQKLFHKEV